MSLGFGELPKVRGKARKSGVQRVCRAFLVFGLLLPFGAAGWLMGSQVRNRPPAESLGLLSDGALLEAVGLLGELEELEAVLVQGAVWVEHHAILADRHQEVSAIACANAESHTSNMEHLAELQKQRHRRIRAAQAAARKQQRDALSGKKLAAAGKSSRAEADSDDEADEETRAP